MSKIWYTIPNKRQYKVLPGVLPITQEDYLPLLDVIQNCITLFNNTIEWDAMWDLATAINRFQEGQMMFIWYNKDGKVIGYYWVDKAYIHNVFIHPSRPDGQSTQFLQTGFNFIEYDELNLYCDDWNKKAQRFFEKLGGIKKSS